MGTKAAEIAFFFSFYTGGWKGETAVLCIFVVSDNIGVDTSRMHE